ncbi:RdgB/HAM1 family non-canonical purine NTP pyrophosphatase [Christensenella sp. MSJ-20]|uniref:RdgB/HAM1 family non-canonical purine NTP pyrophosphatase n=1 Tax=Christensenella sp. MSJ-20 TaxID=2841518 RepID=UPI000D7A5B6E|nr:MAG: non-canonical purine NTP pyrophosphatase, RdgB/HAM1 family [Bacillota bacterium]PWL41540.1 MAG: non-canonical purine NTP pyrophosphatase, RdgB/HAM1 family [Bacillota bacterium]QWT55604.1 RdgB/HAM1 family non-canonical purine NTP pyrophosphatase [Christensenella sp. MSJ-20]
MRKIFIASNNQGKIREIKAILGDFYDEFYTPRDMDHPFEVVEDGDTFEANAVKKAVAGRMSFGMDALADDSGLCVDALDGAPGVYSARYSEEGTDEANNKKLLEALERVPVDQRQARFVSAVALAQKGGRLIVVRGESPGVILTEPRGAGGFGYDPLFYDETYRQTYGEMDEETKNAISHRSRALLALREELMK